MLVPQFWAWWEFCLMTVEIDHRRSSKTPQLLCECDGIGRRMGLKIPGSNTVRVRSPPFAPYYPDVAQLGRAPALGAGCRMFESCHLDQLFLGSLAGRAPDC